MWSRPLIAYLFFLQPIVRGWARYSTQLHLQVKSQPALASEETLLSEAESEVPSKIHFWSKHGVDRFTFLSRILARLESSGWQTRVDSGWENHDVEIFRNQLSNFSLTTASEYLSEGRIFLRCRLEAHWSIVSHVIFWGTALLELLLVGYLASFQPWMWMILLTLPILAWFLEDEKTHQKNMIYNLIGDTAKQSELSKYETDTHNTGLKTQ